MADAAAASDFLTPNLARLHDPFQLRDMDRALQRLLLAIQRSEKIQVHGDYDVDGVTSTVILKTAIGIAGGCASFSIPHRLRDGYGIRDAAVDRAASEGVTLIVSVDTGIRAKAAVDRARELGIDVIITDHHLPEEALPPACAVLNPNRRDCCYPEKHLCGAGVAFKLAQALLSSLGWSQTRLEQYLRSLLKLVAIATIADVVPLTGENRVIVAHGLRGLRDVRNPGLRALLETAGFSGEKTPSASQVAFRIAPRINAAGRMASAEEIIEMFLTNDSVRAGEIAARLAALNQERQETEMRIVEQIVEECESGSIDTGAPALVFCRENWHRGVLGIVASRLVERFARPVFVLSIENGEASGSGRSIPAFHLLESLESMQGLFIKFGGHRQAAGLTMDSARVDEFRMAMRSYAAARLMPDDLLPVQRIDASVRLSELDDDLWKGLGSLAPFGMGNPTPVFFAEGVRVLNDPVVMKEKHVRFNGLQDGRAISFKAFHFADRCDEIQRGGVVDIAFKLEEDDFNGGWTAIVSDIRRSATAAS